MPNESVELCTAFAKYIISTGRLPALKSLKEDTENSVKESHELLKEIRALCSTVNTGTDNLEETKNSVDDIARHEDISKCLASPSPRLLLPDMEHLYGLEVDTEVTMAKTTALLEKLRNDRVTPPTDPVQNNFNFDSDLAGYVTCLEKFGKRLANINTIECDKDSQRNVGLEKKLQILCDDIEHIWKMMQAKMKIKSNKKSPQKELLENSATFHHVESITKLVGTINEVTFLMQNRKNSD